MSRIRKLRAAVGLATAFLALSTRPSAALSKPQHPILIQGALEMETGRLVGLLKNRKTEISGPWTFVSGTVDGYPVIVSRTRMGGAHAASATTAAIARYRPIAVINQGTAGGHDPSLRVGDIVIGRAAVGIAAFKSPSRAAGHGSNSLEWIPLDLAERKGEEDGALHEGEVTRIAADEGLLEVAREAGRDHGPGRVVEGVIGTGEVWNEEIDRIARLRAVSGTSVEEMETAAAAQIARLYGIPFLGIRIVTANVTNGGAYDPATAAACQDFTIRVVRAYVARIRKTEGPRTRR